LNAAVQKVVSRDAKLTGMENRVAFALRTLSEIKRLSDKGSGDTANETRRFAMRWI